MLLTTVAIAAAAALAWVLVQRRQRERARRDLADLRAQVAGIIESAMDAIITVDEGQQVMLFNAAAEEVFGCPRAEAIGAPLGRFIPPRFREAHDEHIRNFGRTGATSRRMGRARVVTGLRRSGEEFPIDASISQVVVHGKRLYTVILRDVTERVQAERDLKESREELRSLAAAANSAREQEKSRIARELHDELGQALTALKLDVAFLKPRVAQDPEARAKLESMQQVLDSTVAATRRISADLRPLMLDDLGLVAACEWLVQNFRATTGIACELRLRGADLDLPDPHATAIFRTLQESLTNVAKHAEAHRVDVTLERDGEDVLLTVTDTGRGFAAADPRKPASFGLLGVRERATSLAGEVRVASAPGQGTRIELKLPAPAEGREAQAR